MYEFNNDCSKNNVIDEKYLELYNYKIRDNNCYFEFIKVLTLINKCLEDNNYNYLFEIIGAMPEFIIITEMEFEKKICSVELFKDLIVLYLYFSNYPYAFGLLTDEEIKEVLSEFKPDMSSNDLKLLHISSYNILIGPALTLASKVEKGMSILNEKEELKTLQRLLIKINCSVDQLLCKFKISELYKFYQVKDYLRDIDYSLGNAILYTIDVACRNENFPFRADIRFKYIAREERKTSYIVFTNNYKRQNDIESEQNKTFRKAITYKDTIVLGDKTFHDLIYKMNLPSTNIYYLNKNELSYFFQTPKTIINTKYKICKYIIIMDEKNANEYFETTRYICNVFGLKLISIIYIQNKNNIQINKNILQHPFIQIVFTYSKEDILNFYEDNLFRLKEFIINYMNENELFEKSKPSYNYIYPKLNEIKVFKEEDNGWDMVRDLKVNIFNLVTINRVLGSNEVGAFIKDMFKVYQENNCVDLFINYYGNYFGADYLVESNASSIALAKMFLYAYTLEEKNGKSFYSLMNND